MNIHNTREGSTAMDPLKYHAFHATRLHAACVMRGGCAKPAEGHGQAIDKGDKK